MTRSLLLVSLAAGSLTAPAPASAAATELAIRAITVRPAAPVVGAHDSVSLVIDVIARGARGKNGVTVKVEPGAPPGPLLSSKPPIEESTDTSGSSSPIFRNPGFPDPAHPGSTLPGPALQDPMDQGAANQNATNQGAADQGLADQGAVDPNASLDAVAPGAVNLGPAESGAPGPDGADPNAADPNAADPNAANAGAVRPGAERPGGLWPGAERPGGIRPGAVRPGGERPGGGRSDRARPPATTHEAAPVPRRPSPVPAPAAQQPATQQQPGTQQQTGTQQEGAQGAQAQNPRPLTVAASPQMGVVEGPPAAALPPRLVWRMAAPETRTTPDWQTWRFLPDKKLNRFYPTGTWTITATARGANGETVTEYASFQLRRATELTSIRVEKTPKSAGGVRVRGSLTRIDPRGITDFGPFGKQRLEIQWRAAGSSTWEPVAVTTTDAAGAFVQTVPPRTGGLWRVRFPGTTNYAPDTTKPRQIAS